jgi:hypothetical protein
MESGGHDRALPYQYREAIAACQNLNAVTS